MKPAGTDVFGAASVIDCRVTGGGVCTVVPPPPPQAIRAAAAHKATNHANCDAQPGFSVRIFTVN